MKYPWKHRCDASPLLLQIDNGLAASPEPSFSVTERSKELIVLLMYDYVIPLNTLPLKRLRPPGLQIPNLKWSWGFLPLALKQLSSNMSWTEIHREKVLWLFFFSGIPFQRLQDRKSSAHGLSSCRRMEESPLRVALLWICRRTLVQAVFVSKLVTSFTDTCTWVSQETSPTATSKRQNLWPLPSWNGKEKDNFLAWYIDNKTFP